MAYGTRSFNAAFTRALQLSLSWAKLTQFLVLIPISLRSISILSFQLRKGLHKNPFPAGIPVKIFESTPTFFHSGYMTCPSQSSRCNHPDYIRGTVQTMKFLIVEPSPLPILIPLGPKYSTQDPVFKYPSSCVEELKV